jgi:hypothetical protein
MTAEALSATEAGASPRSAAADGTSPGEPAEGSAELVEARQSVADLVAARLVQVGGPGAVVNGAHPGDAPPAEPTAGPAPEPGAAEPGAAEPGAAEPGAAEPRREPSADDAPAHDGATGKVPAGAAVAVDGVAAGVGERDLLGEVRDLLPTDDPATAVLDVLRACGWADADEARKLRAEAERMRELLDLVVRDHRAREASVAGLESQQHHWLIPLLRAAHGVAFGSLGAKVALRTAVQDVPERILATAGLRIDYGVEPAGEAQEEH